MTGDYQALKDRRSAAKGQVTLTGNRLKAALAAGACSNELLSAELQKLEEKFNSAIALNEEMRVHPEAKGDELDAWDVDLYVQYAKIRTEVTGALPPPSAPLAPPPPSPSVPLGASAAHRNILLQQPAANVATAPLA